MRMRPRHCRMLSHDACICRKAHTSLPMARPCPLCSAPCIPSRGRCHALCSTFCYDVNQWSCWRLSVYISSPETIGVTNISRRQSLAAFKPSGISAAAFRPGGFSCHPPSRYGTVPLSFPEGMYYTALYPFRYPARVNAHCTLFAAYCRSFCIFQCLQKPLHSHSLCLCRPLMLSCLRSYLCPLPGIPP